MMLLFSLRSGVLNRRRLEEPEGMEAWTHGGMEEVWRPGRMEARIDGRALLSLWRREQTSGLGERLHGENENRKEHRAGIRE